jgi:hypothetical protein
MNRRVIDEGVGAMTQAKEDVAEKEQRLCGKMGVPDEPHPSRQSVGSSNITALFFWLLEQWLFEVVGLFIPFLFLSPISGC